MSFSGRPRASLSRSPSFQLEWGRRFNPPGWTSPTTHGLRCAGSPRDGEAMFTSRSCAPTPTSCRSASASDATPQLCKQCLHNFSSQHECRRRSAVELGRRLRRAHCDAADLPVSMAAACASVVPRPQQLLRFRICAATCCTNSSPDQSLLLRPRDGQVHECIGETSRCAFVPDDEGRREVDARRKLFLRTSFQYKKRTAHGTR